MKKTALLLLLTLLLIADGAAIELPEIDFEPIVTTDGQSANRMVPSDRQRASTPAAVFDISRITVSAAGRQLNIKPEGSDDLIIPMLMEDTGVIGMQWFQPGIELSAAEIQAIQPNLTSIRTGIFTHYVSGKYLRRSSANRNRPMQSFLAKSPYPISIRAMADPTLLPAGSDFPVRLYLSGRAVPGATLTAENLSTGAVQTTRSDDMGFAIVNLQEAGNWRLSFSQIPVQTGTVQSLYTAVMEFDNLAGEQQ